MPDFQCSMLFNAQKQGWSENWWLTAATHAAAQTATLALAGARQLMLAKTVTIEAVRTSDTAVLGDSLVALAPSVPVGGAAPALAKDNPGNAWLSRVNSGPQYRRQLWLRGAPDDWMVFDDVTGLAKIPDPLNKAFTAYMAVLTNKKFAIRALDKAQARTIIQTFTPDAPSGLIKVTAPTHGLNELDQVRIKGALGIGTKILNGVFRIQGRTADTFLIPLPLAALAGVNYVTLSARVQKRAYLLQTVTDGVILRPGLRKTGRAFFVPRGRRRAQK